MPTSVRLDRQTERRLDRLARRTGRSKSSIMRQAIAVLDEQFNEGRTIVEQLTDFVGQGDLGPEVAGRRANELLADGFGRAKRR